MTEMFPSPSPSKRPSLRAAIDAQWHRAGVVAATGTALLMAGTWSGLVPGRIPPPYSLRYLAFWTLYAICAWAWMVALLGAGRRWLDCSGSMIAPLRRIGYALYVIHQPVIVAVAYFVVQWRAPVFVKFVVTLATSAIATIGLAELFARLTGLRRPFGLDPRRRLPAERAA